MSDSLERLYQAVLAAKDLDPAISRTARLFQRGPAKMAKKLAEEAIEVVIDAVNGKTDAVVRESADLLYNLISRRHEHRSVVVTTNLAFKQWGTVFPGAACVVALVDRFAQHCHVLDIEADSWRQKHALRRAGK